jgi:hypothetical protein
MTEPPKPTSKRAQDGTMRVPTLPELCSEAADHVAKARLSLFDQSGDAERALLHLDEAIFCLKRLLAYGRARGINGSSTKLHSA